MANKPLAIIANCPTWSAMHAAPFLLILLAALAGCGTEQSQPVPDAPAESWGKIGPDPATEPDTPSAGPAKPTTKQRPA